MTRNEFKLLYAIKKHGIKSYRELSRIAGVSTGFISEQVRRFSENGLVKGAEITRSGEKALAPYRVKNAVIMAAGMSSRFVPLSLEKPKGLLTVKGEVLIERQIEQLKAAGIHEIVIILGYKKEAFFYLENKYEGIHIIINPEYNTKNNTHTLYLADGLIGNSYICSSDDYFVDNPFEEYVYQSYYAAQHVTEKTNEWYMIPDSKGNILKVVKGGEVGDIMLGHVYWNEEFTSAMMTYLRESSISGRYEQDLWEQIVLENTKKLPPMEIKVYPENSIFEFDSLEELRRFDDEYINDTHSAIMRNICNVMKCRESEIRSLEMIKNGITNTSFVFETCTGKYVYRHPNEGSNNVVSRKHEKESLEIASRIGVESTYYYMNDEEGWKISKYIEGGRSPDYDDEKDSKKVIELMQRLHDRMETVSWEFSPWDDVNKLEEHLRRNGAEISDSEYEELKIRVKQCQEKFALRDIPPRLCHCDTYAGNWLIDMNDDAFLIDWEYAGNADPGCDVGAYIMDSGWTIEDAEKFIKVYCGQQYSEEMLNHYLAYTAVVSFRWYVWALYRESCDIVMGESLYKWRTAAMRFSKYLMDKYK